MGWGPGSGRGPERPVAIPLEVRTQSRPERQPWPCISDHWDYLLSTRLPRRLLTQPGQVHLLLLLAAIRLDRVHDKGRLDTHC